MIRNEVKLIGRLTANPELKYTKETNKALCNVVLAVNSIYSNEAEYLHLVFWNKIHRQREYCQKYCRSHC